MKNLMYYLKSLIGLFLLASIVGITIGIIFENNTYAISSAAAIMLLGFISLVSQLFHLKYPQTP
jgi:hypothetical protein